MSRELRHRWVWRFRKYSNFDNDGKKTAKHSVRKGYTVRVKLFGTKVNPVINILNQIQ